MQNKNLPFISNPNSNVGSTTKQNIIIPTIELTNENSILWELQSDEELRIEIGQKEIITIIVITITLFLIYFTVIINSFKSITKKPSNLFELKIILKN